MLGSFNSSKTLSHPTLGLPDFGFQPTMSLPPTAPLLSTKPATRRVQNRPKGATRISKACDECKVRKTKCDGNMSCSQCIKRNSKCSFDSPSKKRGPKTKSRMPPNVSPASSFDHFASLPANIEIPVSLPVTSSFAPFYSQPSLSPNYPMVTFAASCMSSAAISPSFKYDTESIFPAIKGMVSSEDLSGPLSPTYSPQSIGQILASLYLNNPMSPVPQLQVQLLQLYFNYLHSSHPLISEDNFINSLKNYDGRSNPGFQHLIDCLCFLSLYFLPNYSSPILSPYNMSIQQYQQQLWSNLSSPSIRLESTDLNIVHYLLTSFKVI
jgi:hypothetical protein